MKLEDELRRALTPEDPGESFARGVLQRIESQGRSRSWNAGPRRWRAVAAAAVLAAVATGSTIYYSKWREERVAAERARDAAVLGLQIANAKLAEVQQKLERLGARDERSR
jgi:hypothetical protein